MQISRKIYYELSTGNVILDTGERWGDVVETTRGQDFQSYICLSERVPETVGMIQIPFGQDREMFLQYRYHIDVGTQSIVWDLTPEEEEIVQEQVTIEQLREQLEIQKQAILELSMIIGGSQ